MAERVRVSLKAVFRRRRRLGAADRLELERETSRLGGELQAVRSLLEVVLEALVPRPALVSLRDLFNGAVQMRPTFVEREIEVCVVGPETPIEGCPRVLQAMIERAVRRVTGAGVEKPLVLLRHDNGTALLVGDVANGGTRTVERHRVELAPVLEVHDAVLDAVAQALGLSTRLEAGDRRMRIDLAAA
jgi:hypothetical protein